jgi:hypothetical protein
MWESQGKRMYSQSNNQQNEEMEVTMWGSISSNATMKMKKLQKLRKF